MKSVGIVLRFEFLTYAKRKSYIYLTIGLVLIIAGVLYWPRISGLLNLGGDGDSATSGEAPFVLFVDETNGAAGDAAYYNECFGGAYYFVERDDMSAGEANTAIANGEYAFAVVLKSPLEYTRVVKSVGMYDSFESEFAAVMQQHYRDSTFISLGISESELNEVYSAVVEVSVESAAPSSGEVKDQMASFIYTYALIFVLYFVLLFYGQFVASSVATEKSTRAMELLITSTSPTSLMFGKVLGAGLAGLTQFGVIIGAAIALYAANASYYADNYIMQSIFGMPVSALAYMLLFFVLGFFIYAFLYAAFASLVNSLEELNTATMPVTFIFIIAFLGTMFSMASGDMDGIIITVLSFIPLTSPMAMFARIMMGDISAVQIIISIAILAGSTVGMGFLATSIYKLGVLLYGTPPKPKEVFRLLRANKTA